MAKQKTTFSNFETERYSRHFNLPEFGKEGQSKLKQSKVAVIGCGGLGSPSLLYLTAAGIGCIRIVEFDRVDRSNLQRQILFTEMDIGKPKSDRAFERLKAQNPNVEFEIIRQQISASNALNVLKDCDIILDGTDNFAARYLINDAAIKLGIPLVSASVLRFEGQLGTFGFNGSGCYRCLFPDPPTRKAAPSCAEAGVLGVVPGIMGCLQANEAIKVLTGIGENLSNQLLTFDFLKNDFSKLNFSRQKKCAVCSLKPDQILLSDLEPLNDLALVESIDVKILNQWIKEMKDFILIDVRELSERKINHIKGSIHIPLDHLLDKLDDIPKDQTIIVHCQSGIRSLEACQKLRSVGIEAMSLAGGLDAISICASSSRTKK